jgi:hypothetical protein
VVARAGFGKYGDASTIPAPLKGKSVPVDDPERPYKKTKAVAHPESLRGGRIASPMVNSPNHMGWYGRGEWGDMTDSGDVSANARVSQIKSRGQTMRQGIYYKNASEDAGSVSAVLPSRESFKTHEDFLVEARAQGRKIPTRALKGYTEIPGQQRLF